MASKYSPRVTKPSSPEGKHQNMTLTLGAEPCGPTAPGGLPFVTALAKQCRKWWYFKVGPRPSHLCYTFSITSRLCLESSSTFPGGGRQFFFFFHMPPPPATCPGFPSPQAISCRWGPFFFFFLFRSRTARKKKEDTAAHRGASPTCGCTLAITKKVTTCVGIARSLSS
jgi:hypothetical protein